jgi:hypothetical protein
MDNPVQVKRSTGVRNHNTRNCVAVQYAHRVKITTNPQAFSVELLRSSVGEGRYNPELHFVCTGLSMLKSYGLVLC